jgi:hypothetical protein
MAAALLSYGPIRWARHGEWSDFACNVQVALAWAVAKLGFVLACGSLHTPLAGQKCERGRCWAARSQRLYWHRGDVCDLPW